MLQMQVGWYYSSVLLALLFKEKGKPMITNVPFQLLQTFMGTGAKIQHLAWSPCGKKLAAGFADKTVRVWDTETGNQSTSTFGQHDSPVSHIVWSPDGGKIALASQDNAISIWNSETFAFIQKIKANANQVVNLSWSPEGKYVNATLFIDTEKYERFLVLRSWNIITGKVQKSHQDDIGWKDAYLATSADQQTIALSLPNDDIQIWDVSTITRKRTFQSHYGAFYGVALSPDKNTIIIALADGTIRIWKGGGEQFDFPAHKQPVYSLSFSYDGRFFATKSMDNTVRIWQCDTSPYQLKPEIQEPSVGDEQVELAFSPSAMRLATYDEQNTAIRIWERDVTALFSTKSQQTTNDKTFRYHAILLTLSDDDLFEFIEKEREGLKLLTGDHLAVYGDIDCNDSAKILERFSPPVSKTTLPAILLWENSLSNSTPIPLKRLSHDDVFAILKLIVKCIQEGKGLQEICNKLEEYDPEFYQGQVTNIYVEYIREVGFLGDNNQVGRLNQIG